MQADEEKAHMNNIPRWFFGIGTPVAFFDKVQFRLAKEPAERQMNYLRQNCRSARVGWGNPIRDSDKKGRPIRGSGMKKLLTVVSPNELALEALANMPGLMVNGFEEALNYIMPDASAAHFTRDSFDKRFVHAWHGKKHVRLEGAGTYTDSRPGRSAGRQFSWYSDRGCKRTGDPFCFHIEGRHEGVEAVRRAGIYSAADLVAFDHEAYWAKHMNLYEIDFEVLGRFHQNRRAGRRRQKLQIDQIGPLTYNRDRRIGQTLFRALGMVPDDDSGSLDHREHLSVQEFIDRYGRGPFLRRIDASAFMPRAGGFI